MPMLTVTETMAFSAKLRGKPFSLHSPSNSTSSSSSSSSFDEDRARTFQLQLMMKQLGLFEVSQARTSSMERENEMLRELREPGTDGREG